MAGFRARIRQLALEGLTARLCMSADLQIVGPDEIGQVNVNVSSDSGTSLERIQAELSLDVNQHPLFAGNLVGISHALGRHPLTSRRNYSLEVDVYFSLDSGETWRTRRFTDSTRAAPDFDTDKIKHFDDGFPQGFRFDPTISIDAASGNVYIGYSVWAESLQWLVVGRSTDGGDTWQLSVAQNVTVPAAASSPRLDKFHLSTGPDPSTPGNRAVYITYGDVETPQRHNVWVAGTNYAGDEWHNASWTQQLVSNNPGLLAFPDPAVGPSGELYVAWLDLAANGSVLIDVDRDGLFGNQYQFDQASDTVITPLVSPLNALFVPPQRQRGIFNALMLDADVSNNELTRGRLYVTFVDHRNMETRNNDPSDVDIFVGWLQPPPSGPLTGWSISAIENDTTTDFNPWLDVDQTSGSVSLVYYRSQESNGGTERQVHFYLRNSLNGGQTFGARTRLSAQASNASDVPARNDYHRDYLEYSGLVAHAGTVHALWAQVNYADFDAPRGDLEAYFTRVRPQAAAGRRLVVRADRHGLEAESIVISVSAESPLTFTVDVGGQRQFEGLAEDVDEIFIEGLEANDTVVYPANPELQAKMHVAPIAKVVLANPGSIAAGDGSEMRFLVTAPPGRYVRLFVNGEEKHAQQLGENEQRTEFIFNTCGRTQEDPACQSDDSGTTRWWRGGIDGQVVYTTHAASITDVQSVPLTKMNFGDFDRDTVISAADIDFLTHHLSASINNADLDFDRDNDVDSADLEEFVNLVLRTHLGDANLDGIFDSTDVVDVLSVGEYEESTSDNSGWADGDWDGNQDFGSSDLIIALADGGYMGLASDARPVSAFFRPRWSGRKPAQDGAGVILDQRIRNVDQSPSRPSRAAQKRIAPPSPYDAVPEASSAFLMAIAMGALAQPWVTGPSINTLGAVSLKELRTLLNSSFEELRNVPDALQS
jgi:hypothetical protein